MTPTTPPAHTGARLAALALAWIGGVAVQLQEAALRPVALYGLALAVGALGLLLMLRWRRAWALGIVGAALLGCGATGLQASLRLADELPAELEGRDLRVVGIVASLPQASASGTRFRLRIEQASLDGRPVRVPPLLALGWYKGWHEDAATLQPGAALRAGQRWELTVRLRRPHGNLNPHGHDYELTLFEQGLRATGYVRDAPARRLDDAAGYPLERLRQRVRDAIDAAVPDRHAAGVLAALAVGDQAAIEREDWELFRNAGVAHLMSISGLHVTMFAWLAGLAVAAGWRRSARLALWLPVPQAARWGGVAAAFAYALFSGWGVPSQRTVWMLAVVTLLQSIGVRWPWLLVLLAAAVVVTAIDPWALMQAGFWLSFAAVALLMVSEPMQGRVATAPARPGWRGWAARLGRALHGGLRTQLIATLGLTPLTLLFFQQVSLVGLASNLIAIPLVTLLITPLALLGSFVAPLWALGALAVRGLNAFLEVLVGWPGAVWTVPAAPLWAQLAGLLGAALLVLPLPWRLRLLALPLALPLLLPPPVLPAEGQFDVIALDVGQGTSVLVRTHGHVLLFDAGPQYSRDSDAGQRVLLPLLRGLGIARLDRLVLSHRDTDHVGGARALLGALAVDDVLSSLEAGHALLAQAPHATRCAAGQAWRWDGVRFEVLRPPLSDYALGLKPNALSCVLRVSASGYSVLMTGDIEREQEAALVAAHGPALRSDVLIVAHHGSRTSSTGPFLDAVAPRIAVVQAGYRNRFGHPAPDVLARLQERGITVRASPDCGAWRASSSSAAAEVCERNEARRYWHHGGPRAGHQGGASAAE